MNKPIMIDGVDVSECDFYCKKPRRLKGDNISDVITWCQARYIPCSDYDNCYFKRLQWLKAENERLSELTCVNCGEKFLSPTGSELYEENVQLKAENEELKKYEYTYLDKYIDLKQVLEDVRKITNNFFEECGIPDDYFKRNNYSWKQHQIKALTCKIKQIKDKINEVLGD